jgi:prepilin-type N-terminal cleavage/methylation domain-containing protein
MKSLNGARRVSQEKGFTLVEVLIVVIIVAILAAIAVPQYLQYVKGARAADAKVQINAIYNASKIYKQEYDQWPQSVDELQEKGYVQIDQSTERKWQFEIIGDNQIQATSTAEMAGGPNHTVIFDIQEGAWNGYGFPGQSDGSDE